MPTKKQHFVPRVYMKAWETQVETLKEPDKKFNGIYVIKDGSIGDGANRNSVLWKPHLYTINFKYSFICNSCAKVKSQYVDLIYDLLKTGFKQPVYGKLGYSIIKTKKSINKHFFEILSGTHTAVMVLFTLLGSPDLRIQSSVLSLSDFDECNLVRIARVAKRKITSFTLICFF